MRNPTTIEIAYFAGFFDGEGHIGKTRKRDRYAIKVALTQNDRAPLDLARSLFGGSVSAEVNSNGATRHRWVATGAPAASFLVTVLPFLIVKRERATIALSVEPCDIPPTRGGDASW